MSFTFSGKFVIRLNKFVKSYTVYLEYKQYPVPTNFSFAKSPLLGILCHTLLANVQFDTIRFMPCLLLKQWQSMTM